MKLIVPICVVFALCLTACSPKLPTVSQPTTTPTIERSQTPIPTVNGIATDSMGNQYRFVSPETKNADGSVTTELWEKIKPLDTNRWYTPTLGSRFDTNHPPLFNSLMR